MLLGLRLRGFAEPGDAVAFPTLPADVVAAELARLAGAGLVRHQGGRVSGWTLTAAGRRRGERLLAEEADQAGARSALDAAYAEFRLLNGELLAACTQWQLRDVDGRPVVNDHADGDHDAAAVARLARVDEAVQPVAADLAAALDRFGPVGPRLAEARRRVEAGEGDWFTRPTIDSYHTVWFELHENLLATLGIERAAEAPA